MLDTVFMPSVGKSNPIWLASRHFSRAKPGFDTDGPSSYIPDMLTAEPIAHIYRDAAGVAWIDRTRVKVMEVALDHLANSWSAEEIHRQHPDLSLAQIHAALGYYYDHQVAFDKQIAQDLTEAERLAGSTADSPLRRRLRLLQRPA
jgi:uncharacterized protein (DUF433 family)